MAIKFLPYIADIIKPQKDQLVKAGLLINVIELFYQFFLSINCGGMFLKLFIVW